MGGLALHKSSFISERWKRFLTFCTTQNVPTPHLDPRLSQFFISLRDLLHSVVGKRKVSLMSCPLTFSMGG